jgi:type II secretory pathway component PulC
MIRFGLIPIFAAQAWRKCNLPKLVSAILIVAICAECGNILRQLTAPWPQLAAIPAARRITNRQPRAHDAFDIQALIDAHLFGVADPERGSAVAETKEPLYLRGTLATDEPGEGMAIVGSSDTSSTLYHVGSDMPGGLQLRQVFADHIIMSRGAALEGLYLPGPATAGDRAGGAPPHAAAESALVSGGDIVREINLRAAPRGSRGLRVYGTNTAALAGLGLAPGDIVHEINGVSMDEPNAASGSIDIAQILSQGESMSMIVERQGMRTAVTLNAPPPIAASAEPNPL